MKWSIDKEFHFEMGHRVWAQKLDRPHLSISTDCACKHLHGHSYVIKVELSSPTLNSSGMVLDFKEINFMKQFVDDVLDHKFMLDVNDPNFKLITGVSAPAIEVNFTNLTDLIDTDEDQPDVHLHRSSFVLVDFVPTSENICKYLKLYAQDVLGDVATVTAVELWETKKSHCRFVG